MNFNSIEFLIFYCIVLLMYWIVPYKIRWILLLAASWYFYMSWNPKFLLLILSTTAVTFFCAREIEKTESKRKRKIYLMITVIICFGELIFFKYFNFLINSLIHVGKIFHSDIQDVSFNILLPVGISFYTFQTMSYVFDVYRRKVPAERHFGYYALFVAYFPQLVAGPIERPDNLLPQLKKEQHLSISDFSVGMRYILSGFFRKCIVADFCGIYVTNIFHNINEANSFTVFLAGILFCIQMYCDFAGYSEIAVGAARMMGVRLMRNFDRPYLSQSYSEFFRRWHISLSSWFSEYVYIPLGGSRRGKGIKIRNTLIVFFLCGLWHGANWTYVLWGLYAAFWICMESAFKTFFSYFQQNRILRLLRRILLMLVFVPAALLFRAPSLQDAGIALKKLFFGGIGSWKETISVLNMGGLDAIVILLAIFCMCFLYYMSEYECGDGRFISVSSQKWEAWFYGERISVYVLIIITVVIGWLVLINGGDSSSFAYFQF